MELKPILGHAYNRDNYIALLQHLSNGGFSESLQTADHLLGANSKIKQATQLGSFYLDDIEISVWEIHHNSSSDPRVTLTKETLKIMGKVSYSYALVSYVSRDENKQRRFSLITRGYSEGEEKISSPRRFSFLLGEGEKIKTPTDSLKKPVTDIDDLTSRFDVEVVRKEFFKQYLNLFIELYEKLKPYESIIGMSGDLVTFTKTLMGKIIFLYFIQKKGRLGVATDEDWGSGKKDFIRFLFEDYRGEGKLLQGKSRNSFYNDYLEPLFYEALSNERDTDIYERFSLKIPYLNGGLFEQEYDRKNTLVNPQDEIFEKIIDTFDRYNFTIHEDDPYDREIAVDPEMLGKIFETMISVSKDNIEKICDIYNKMKMKSKAQDKIIGIDIGKDLNKKFGAFYTPRDIVHYMTKESLIYYLVNNIKEARPEETAQQIEKIVRELFDLKDNHLLKDDVQFTEQEFNLFEQYVILISKLLKKAKVLDPAVGSGAFPMGILHEIFGLRRYLIDFFGLEKETDYNIKKSIIQENIYGVDIEPGAIDIARLRFRLSLVVDADKPEPLPNLDFKFVCANTLIPLEGGSLFTRQELIDELNGLRKQYFSTQKKSEKDLLKKKFYKVQQELCGFVAKPYFNSRQEQKEYIESLVKQNTDPRNRQIMQWDPFDTKSSSNLFDTELMFGIGGFDIVIGNPPYIRVDDIDKEDREKYSKVYSTCAGKYDIYYLFFEKGSDVLVKKGILSFITPNRYCSTDSGSKLREVIANRFNSIIISSVSKLKVFENASTYPCISILRGKGLPMGYLYTSEVRALNHLGNVKQYDQYSSEMTKKIPMNIFPLNSNKDIILLFIRLRDQGGINLGDVMKIQEGLRIPADLETQEVSDYHILKQYQFSKYSSIAKGSYITEDNMLSVVKETSDRFQNLKKAKVVIAEDALCIQATLDTQGSICQGGVYFGTVTTDINIKILLGILNSKLLSVIYENLFGGMHMGGGYLRYRSNFLNYLPIPDGLQDNVNVGESIVDLVDKILEKKEANHNDDTSALEALIDNMIYKLYGLTYDEVRVVDPACTISKEDYDNFSI